MVEEFSHGSGLALSAVVLIRFLPSLLLCPIAGAVADRWVGGGAPCRTASPCPPLTMGSAAADCPLLCCTRCPA